MARAILSCLKLGLAAAAAAGTAAGLTGYNSPELVAAGTAVGGLAGNLTTELCKALYRPAAARWLEGRFGIDENHQVASALRLAQLAGLRAVLTVFDEAWSSDWDRARRAEAERFSRALARFLDEESESAQQARFGAASRLAADERRIRDEVLAGLPDIFDESLAARRANGDDIALRDGLAELRRATETAVLAEVRLRTDSLDQGLPNAFVHAFDGSGVPDGWFDLFVRDAASRLNEDGFQRVWNAEQLALVKAITAAQSAVLAEINKHTIETNERTKRIEKSQADVLAAIQALGVPLPVLRDILEGFGELAAEMSATQLEQKLRVKADEYRELRDRLSRLTNDDPRVQALRRTAGEQIGAGDFTAADATLLNAEQLDLAVIEELEQHAERGRASAATTRAERAAAARLRLDYRTEAAHYRAAAEIVARDAAAVWGYRLREAFARYSHGSEFGDNRALHESVDVYRTALGLAPRAERPLDWAMTQNSLGNALARIGERESGTARLEEAVEAYRAALEESTRERVPPQWAMTQNNLGNALLALGERESDPARLEEALESYRAALEESTRERAPLDWAMTQNNLGNALARIGERESSTARLEEAVKAYRAALEEYTRERVPLQWAMIQNNLGNALARIGERESGTARLEEAVKAYRAALEEYTRDRAPLQWAATQNNLGKVLLTLGKRESGTARLQEAVEACRAALEENTREQVPLDWATTQNNLGHALLTLGERESGSARLEEAVDAFRAALEESTRERVPLDWAKTQDNLGNALLTLGGREGDGARLLEAVDAYRGALKERTREGVPLDWAMTQNNLGNALTRIGERESGTGRLEEAVEAYRAALEETTRERVPLQWATIQNNLGCALVRIAERECGTARLQEAVDAFRAALEIRTRELVPPQWATTQNNLGNALVMIGEREGGTARLQEAVEAYDKCLTVVDSAWPRESVEQMRSRRNKIQTEIARRQGS